MSKQPDSITQKSEPWGPAQDSLIKVLEASGGMFDSGSLAPSVYDGQRVADFSGATQRGLRRLSGAVSMPDARKAGRRADHAYSGARGAFNSFLDDGATYRDFDRIKSTVADDVKAQLGGTFAGGGLESGLAQQTYARGLGDALANVEYGAWNSAQDRKLAAMGFAPTLSDLGGERAGILRDARMTDARNELMAGGLRDTRRQALLDADRAVFDETEMQPINNLLQYANLASGVAGMGGIHTAPNLARPSTLGSVAGAGATGLGMYGALLGSGVGAPIAIGGGLLAGLGGLL